MRDQIESAQTKLHKHLHLYQLFPTKQKKQKNSQIWVESSSDMFILVWGNVEFLNLVVLCATPSCATASDHHLGTRPLAESTPADDVEPLMEAAQQFVLEGVTSDGLHKLITTLGMSVMFHRYISSRF